MQFNSAIISIVAESITLRNIYFLSCFGTEYTCDIIGTENLFVNLHKASYYFIIIYESDSTPAGMILLFVFWYGIM